MTERGSALLLVPTMVLVVIGLAAVSVDGAVIAAEQRELVSAAQAAAADGASAGVDVDGLRANGSLQYDPIRVGRSIQRSVAAHAPEATVRWMRHNNRIEVRLCADVSLVFARGLGGRSGNVRLCGRAHATLEVQPP